jgi:hypothetical protein
MGRSQGKKAGLPSAETFSIYDYWYRFAHDDSPTIWHTERILLVFDAEGKYLGRYWLRNESTVSISGTHVLWKESNEDGGTWGYQKWRNRGAIDFAKGPPAEAYSGFGSIGMYEFRK